MSRAGGRVWGMDTATVWDQMWLPLWPLASDDLVQGVYRAATLTVAA